MTNWGDDGNRAGCPTNPKEDGLMREFALEGFVAVDDLADEVAFFAVGAGEEAAFETGDDDVAEFAGGHFNFVDGEAQFVGDGGVGHETVVGADGNGQFVVEHLAKRMLGKIAHAREGLGVAGEADFHGDALAGDVFGEMVNVRHGVVDGRVLDHLVREEPGAMADAVGIAFRDRLEDGLGPVGFAGVDGLADEMGMDVLVGGAVVVGRITRFRAREIEADDGQAFVVSQVDGRAGQFHRGSGADLGRRRVGHDLEEASVVRRHLRDDEAQRADDDTKVKRDVGAGADGLREIVAFLRATESAANGGDDFLDVEPVIDVQLRRVADFDVADALGKIVFGQFESDALEALGGLHHGAGVGEALQVFGKIGVLGLEDEATQSVLGVGRQLDAVAFGQFDQGGDAQRAVEVQMQVGLGDAAEEFGGYGFVHWALFHQREQIAAGTLRSAEGNIKQNRRKLMLCSSRAIGSVDTRKEASNRVKAVYKYRKHWMEAGFFRWLRKCFFIYGAVGAGVARNWKMDTNLNTITVTLDDGLQVRCAAGTPVCEILPHRKSPSGLDYIAALVNNDAVSVTYPVEVDSKVTLLTRADSDAFQIYRRSVCFLLAKAIRELFPEARFAIEHSLGSGFYCSFEMSGKAGLCEEQLQSLDRHMRAIVGRDLPIERRKIAFTEVVRRFEQEKQWDKYNLLRFSNPPKVATCWCENFSDLDHGPLAPSTGSLTLFKLISYAPGFVLQVPEREKPKELPPFEPQPQLFRIFKEHKEWGRILGVNTVGRLNEIIANKEISDFIKIAEAFHEKKIAQTADHIYEHRGQIKWALIAGPSSSGKTTFAKRLMVQLRVNGLRPVAISLDNYFVNRDHTPLDEHGKHDFENIETVDLRLFNDHLMRLDKGEEVELPSFNFEKGCREFRGEKLRIEPDQIVLVEGIHGLNPRLTESVPPAHKLRIYISALTQLNLDSNNRISTTDNRLVRRMVRDNNFRGNTALATLNMWPSVRRGEKTWIFPFQQSADIAFNSALDYELAVLKPFVEPLLVEIKPYHPQYAEARRLLAFLSSFLSVPDHLVPPTSILREFIGHSSFRY
jgi:uridine kinase